MNQNGGIHKGGFAVLCHRNGGSESPGILIIGLEAGILHGVIMFADFHTKDACHICFAASCSAGNKDVTVFRNVFAGCRTAD